MNSFALSAAVELCRSRTCEVTGRRRCSEIVDKGLVIPCVHTLVGKLAIIKSGS